MTNGVMAASQGHPSELQRQIISEYRQEVYDLSMLQALTLLWAKLCLVTAISVLFSTVATSTVFIVGCTLLVYFAGHLQSVARDFWLAGMEGISWPVKFFLVMVSWLIPDFQTFNLIDEIIAGNKIQWQVTMEVLSYAGVYALVALAIASLIFEAREL